LGLGNMLEMQSSQDSILITLGELKGKMDAVLAGQQSLGQKIDEHDKRIGKLENSKSWVIGAAAVISGAIGMAIKVIGGGN